MKITKKFVVLFFLITSLACITLPTFNIAYAAQPNANSSPNTPSAQNDRLENYMYYPTPGRTLPPWEYISGDKTNSDSSQISQPAPTSSAQAPTAQTPAIESSEKQMEAYLYYPVPPWSPDTVTPTAPLPDTQNPSQQPSDSQSTSAADSTQKPTTNTQDLLSAESVYTIIIAVIVIAIAILAVVLKRKATRSA